MHVAQSIIKMQTSTGSSKVHEQNNAHRLLRRTTPPLNEGIHFLILVLYSCSNELNKRSDDPFASEQQL